MTHGLPEAEQVPSAARSMLYVVGALVAVLAAGLLFYVCVLGAPGYEPCTGTECNAMYDG